MPPVFAAFFAALPFIGQATITIGSAAISVAQVLGYIAYTAAMVGAAYYFAQQNKPRGSPNKRTLKQATSPRWRIYGRMRTAGLAFCYEAKGSMLMIGLAMCSDRIAGFDVIYLDDRKVEPDPVTFVLPGGIAFIEQKLGTTDQTASSLFLSRIPEIWTADHRNRGVACLYCGFEQVKPELQKTVYPNGFPEVTAVVRGALIWDPRDEAQDPNDSSTWTHGDNAALVILDFLRHADGARMRLEWINIPSFIKAANDCDRQVGKYGGGTEPWARISGIYFFDAEARQTLSRMLASCDGILSEGPDGKITLRIDGWEEPVVTITSQHISAIEIVKDKSRLVTINDLRWKWMDPAREYELQDGTPITDESSIDALGIRLTSSIDFDFVQSGSQGYRLAYRHFQRENPPSRLSITLGPYGMKCLGQRRVRVQDDIAEIDGVYRVLGLEPIEGLHKWTIALAEVTREMFVDVIPPEDPSRTLPTLTPAVIPLPLLTVTPVTHGAPIALTYLRAVAADPVNESLTLEVEYRRESETDDDWRPYNDVIDDLRQEAGPVDTGDPADIYESRARWVPAAGLPGNWSPIVTTDLS